MVLFVVIVSLSKDLDLDSERQPVMWIALSGKSVCASDTSLTFVLSLEVSLFRLFSSGATTPSAREQRCGIPAVFCLLGK